MCYLGVGEDGLGARSLASSVHAEQSEKRAHVVNDPPVNGLGEGGMMEGAGGGEAAVMQPDPPEKDYHSLYVRARASHEKTVYQLRQLELQLAGRQRSLPSPFSASHSIPRAPPIFPFPLFHSTQSSLLAPRRPDSLTFIVL